MCIRDSPNLFLCTGAHMTDDPTGPLIQLRDFGLGFRTPDGFRQVLHDIDITVRPGEMVGLVGESGSGKTVTAKYVLGILPPRTTQVVSGTASLLGQDLLTATPRQRMELKRYIAYVPVSYTHLERRRRDLDRLCLRDLGAGADRPDRLGPDRPRAWRAA